MGKKRSWFSWVKKIFASDAKPKTEKKSKRCRWIFGRLKLKQYQPALAAPPRRSLCQATEEKRKHALNVAIATAAVAKAAVEAAQAAVEAAQAAAEVVRFVGASKSFHHFTTKDRNRAAIKIQAAFRAHLARKALRALRGTGETPSHHPRPSCATSSNENYEVLAIWYKNVPRDKGEGHFYTKTCLSRHQEKSEPHTKR
ncbi:uncharacterized protein LOC120153772 [Hibiscus syriacus]|uniref:uncharacterized protein LOC120153772 n=1 Tax=Hibiscus syriacus TaxID=106335 RepID=UPI001921E567|nr:uncharacterized protein LOC120153772 [Hibiscus syriacus]